MAPRSRPIGSADSMERQIEAGRRRTTTPAPASSGVGEFGSNEAWNQLYGNYLNELQDLGLVNENYIPVSGTTAGGVGSYLGQRARTTAPTAATAATTGGGTGGMSAGQRNTLSALQSWIAGLGGGSEADITSGYGSLIDAARTRGAEQQAMIDRFYGGAESAAQNRLNQTLASLQSLIGGARTELDTQSAEGRQRIDEATQRVAQALAGQQNPFAGLMAQAAPVAQAPLMANLQALGQNTQGLSALQDMLISDAAQNRNAMQDMINMLSASEQAARQSRAADVEFARSGAQQDLAANQRAAAQLLTQNQIAQELAARQAADREMFQLGEGALQARLAGANQLGDILSQLSLGQLGAVLGERQTQAGQRNALAEQLLALATTGVDVSGLMRQLLGGGR